MLKRKIANAPLYTYLLALFFTLIAILLTVLFRPIINDAPFLFFFVALVLSAWRGGLGPGMVSAAITVIAVGFLYSQPVYTVLTTPSELLKFAIFSLVAFFIGGLEESRRRSQQFYRDARDELSVILNSVADGITAQDEDGNVIFANAAAARLTGYTSPEAMTALAVGEIQRNYAMFDMDNNSLSYAALPRHHVFKYKQSAALEFKVCFADNNEERWLNLSSAPVFDAHGNVKLAVNIFRDITERIRRENDLSRYAVLVNNSRDAIIGKSLERIITDWNPGAQRLYGYTAEEAIGQHISMLFPPHLKAIEMGLIDRLNKGEKIEQYETKRLHKDGYEVDVSLSISPIRTADGQITGYSTIERDMRERIRLLQQLQQEKHKLTTIIDTIPGIVYEGASAPDAATQRMAYISSYAEHMLGYTLDEWYSVPNFWNQVVHPDDLQRAITLADQTYQEGVAGPVSFRCIAKDGRVLHTEAYNAVITDYLGNPVGTSGLVLDVTERKQRDEKVLQLTALIETQRQRLSAMISNVPGIIFESTIDPDANHQTVNFMSGFVEKMLGYSPNCWYDNPAFWEQIVDPEDLQASLAEAAAAYESNRATRVQFRCRHADGETIFAESFFNFVQDGTLIRQYGVIMDVSDRRAIEDALREYAEELRRSNQELEQFANIASHDLQEPLRMVTSYLQIIEQRYAGKLDDDANEFIGFAVDGATRMKALINDLLTYSRVQRSTAEFTPVEMEKVLDGVRHNLQLTIEDTQAVITHDDLPQVTANEPQMTQLLQNLLSNALKFHGDAPPHIHISAERQRNQWQFSVCDNGIGIEPEYQQHIFVIFRRLHTREEYPGTGIGLAICRKIVEKHGGTIWVESQTGEGTTFYFTIPLHQRKKRYAAYAAYRDPAG